MVGEECLRKLMTRRYTSTEHERAGASTYSGLTQMFGSMNDLARTFAGTPRASSSGSAFVCLPAPLPRHHCPNLTLPSPTDRARNSRSDTP